jgi:hypothetical protein
MIGLSWRERSLLRWYAFTAPERPPRKPLRAAGGGAQRGGLVASGATWQHACLAQDLVRDSEQAVRLEAKPVGLVQLGDRVDERKFVGVWWARPVDLADGGWRLAELEQLVDPAKHIERLQRLLRAAPLARAELLQQPLAPFETPSVQWAAALPGLEQQIEGAARAALGNGFGATPAITRAGGSMLAGHRRKLPK